jgi:hypothetical protein
MRLVVRHLDRHPGRNRGDRQVAAGEEKGIGGSHRQELETSLYQLDLEPGQDARVHQDGLSAGRQLQKAVVPQAELNTLGGVRPEVDTLLYRDLVRHLLPRGRIQLLGLRCPCA